MATVMESACTNHLVVRRPFPSRSLDPALGCVALYCRQRSSSLLVPRRDICSGRRSHCAPLDMTDICDSVQDRTTLGNFAFLVLPATNQTRLIVQTAMVAKGTLLHGVVKLYIASAGAHPSASSWTLLDQSPKSITT